MDDRESSTPKIRKRTESNGGSSDSELSEGWNIVDQTDVVNNDVTSSDGESVEVIDGEDESRENGTDTDGESQPPVVSETPVVPYQEPEVPAVPRDGPQEEMFDSSFRWFLIYAAAAVLVSNLAFMIAENTLPWNADLNIEAPSFLRDLPISPKLGNGNHLVRNVPWADKDDAVVEDFVDDVSSRHSGRDSYKGSHSYEDSRKQPHQKSSHRFDKHRNERYNKQLYDKNYKKDTEKISSKIANLKPNEHPFQEAREYYTLNVDDHTMWKYFNILSEVATSSETKDRLNLVFLILDALYIGLNDLEEKVTENSELQNVLKHQKHKLSQVLTEIEYSVSKSLDRVAMNVLNKVRKLERRFEHQWCELEKSGHQEELKGLFYDCQGSEAKTESEHQINSEQFERTKIPIDSPAREEIIIDKWDSYQYQVDKDSPGKDNSNTLDNTVNEMDDYYMLVTSETQNDVKPSMELKNSGLGNRFDDFVPTQDINEDNNYRMESTNDVEKNNVKNWKHFRDKRNYDKIYENAGKHGGDKGKPGYGENHDEGVKQYNSDGKYYSDKEEHYNNHGKHYDDNRKQYNSDGKHYNDKGRNNNGKKHYDGKGNQYNREGKHYNDRRKHSNDRLQYDNKGKHHYNKDKLYDEKVKHYNSNGKYNDDKGKQKYDKHSDDKKQNYHDEHNNHYNDKGKQYKSGKHYNDKEKHNYDKRRVYDGKKTYSQDMGKFNDRFENYKSTEEHSNNYHPNNKERHSKSENPLPNSQPELIKKYLKESCEKGKNKLNNMYDKLKSFIDSQLRVPKEMFDSLFEKYCRVKDDSFKWEKRFNREYPKGDFSKKSIKKPFKDELVIEDSGNNDLRMVDVSELKTEEEPTDSVGDNIIIPNYRPRQWVFGCDEQSHDNNSNLTGDWFIKAGESRSKMRWSHHRGDWWFERAYHRRTQPRPNWFSGKRKNWYFRRAWARQNCRQSPNQHWCDFPEEETVTVPNPSMNFR